MSLGHSRRHCAREALHIALWGPCPASATPEPLRPAPQVTVAVEAPAETKTEEAPHPNEGDFSSKLSFWESVMQVRPGTSRVCDARVRAS